MIHEGPCNVTSKNSSLFFFRKTVIMKPFCVRSSTSHTEGYVSIWLHLYSFLRYFQSIFFTTENYVKVKHWEPKSMFTILFSLMAHSNVSNPKLIICVILPWYVFIFVLNFTNHQRNLKLGFHCAALFHIVEVCNHTLFITWWLMIHNFVTGQM